MSDRPPFDPTRIRPPAADSLFSAVDSGLITVRQVNELVRGAINQHLPPTLHVVGEIGDVSRPASGHLYFTLKDPASELRSVMWRSAAAKVRFELKPGLEVVATGQVEVYTPRGTYQLIVRRLEPRGVGALELAFRQLREKLEREGLFHPDRKRPLPRLPGTVAVVTSLSGAAIRDIVRTLARRFPPLDVLIFPVRVQGEGAAAEIAAAIHFMNEHADTLGGIDVAIIGRGGGSLEDLWAFNEEIVARAIAASRIPIVSGVGHEVDVSISDLVADVRAATPTAAAELITPDLNELLAHFRRQEQLAARAALHALERARAALSYATAYDSFRRPLARLRERAQLVDEWQQRCELTRLRGFQAARSRLDAARIAIMRLATGELFERARHRLTRTLYGLQHALGRVAVLAERRLGFAESHLQRAAPLARLERADERLAQHRQRVMMALRERLSAVRGRLAARLDVLASCDPHRVLRRGYSITRDARSRRVLRSITTVREGERIRTQLADGEFLSTADDPRQPGLFDE